MDNGAKNSNEQFLSNTIHMASFEQATDNTWTNKFTGRIYSYEWGHLSKVQEFQ